MRAKAWSKIHSLTHTPHHRTSHYHINIITVNK